MAEIFSLCLVAGLVGLTLIGCSLTIPLMDPTVSSGYNHWLLGIGIMLYLVVTVITLLLFRSDPKDQAFDFSGYYTDLLTHFELIGMSIPAYIIILTIQVRKTRKIFREVEADLRQRGLLSTR